MSSQDTIKEFEFGTRSSNTKSIKAESLEEALNEFVLSCIDFSEFAYRYAPIEKEILQEPYGYTRGIKNEDYPKHRFYELIPVFCEKELVKELSLTEFQNWHLRQNNILENNSCTQAESKSITSSTMIQMNKHIIDTSIKIRQLKLNMALEKKYNKNHISVKLDEMKKESKKIQEEYKQLNKKMNILKTYAGIGRDIVKIKGGAKSDKLKIDVFQTYRLMKEDIEILSDFREFDARTVEVFDKFILENYKELLPSEKCIQAYKVTNQSIDYENPFEKMTMDKENKKVFIFIRNGENIYRIFNSYDLHNDFLFVLGEPTEIINNLIKELLRKNSFSFSDKFKELKNSYDAKISKSDYEGKWLSRFHEESCYICELPFDYNENTLLFLTNEANEKYEEEEKRRKAYIAQYDLSNELDIYSWRWGKSLGRFKRDCNEKLNEIKYNMEIVEAYKKNDYFTIYALSESKLNSYSYIRKDEEYNEMKPYEDGFACVDYFTSDYNREKNDFSDNFDPITCEPNYFEALWYDFDKCKEISLDNAREKLQKELSEQNYKNFNSVAILQNILDCGIIFDDLPTSIDLIMGKGVELLNFVKDGMNLLNHSTNYVNLFSSKDELKKGEQVYVLRKEGACVVKYQYGQERDERWFDKHQVILGTVKSIKGDEVKVHGYFDIYLNSCYDKHICQGNAKLGTVAIKDHWLLVKASVSEEEILKLLKNRHFRETEFETKGVGLKEVLELKRNSKLYNFSGGWIRSR